MNQHVGPTSFQTYEERLDADFFWALNDTGLFLEGSGTVRHVLRRFLSRLTALRVSYAIAGGIAVFEHGYQRATGNINVLVTRNGLAHIHEALNGLGYVPPFAGSKNLRDVEDGVRIEFLITGEFPGDGKPKPVAFPDPSPPEMTVERDGIRFLALVPLIELKLASGMTNPGRLKDLADVQELIRIRKLDEAFAEKLNPYVRGKYAELLAGVRAMPVDPEQA